MRTLVVAATLCGLLLTGAAQAVTTIDPADPDILYTGRWSSETPSEPWCFWIGSSIIARFEGTSVAATLSAGSGGSSDYLRVIIDDDPAGSSKIAVGSSAATRVLASGLTDTEHKVEIIKETDIGNWVLYSLDLDDGKALATPPERPSRRIEFYGDSNLAGYSLEHEENNGGTHLRGSYRGYAGIASRMLDAEYHNISRSGARIADINGVYDRYAYFSPNPQWDFGAFTPDVVVVNLGANDVGRPRNVIKNAYHAFLDDLRATHPDAHVVLYNSWGWDYDEPASYTHEVIDERDDPNMSVATFPWIFEQWHGCEYDHGGMAQILADHLTAVMGWEQGTADVMNGFGMNGDVANGSFEEQAPFGGYGWRYYTHAGVSRVHDPAGAFDGEYYLRLMNSASSHQPIPAVDGQTFVLQARVRGASGGDQVSITMDFRDQEMWTTPLQTETETFSLTSDWQQCSMTATAPTGAAHPVFHTRVTFTASAGDVVDIDDVSMAIAVGVSDSESSSVDRLLTASPNPFNSTTEIRFALPAAGDVDLRIFDLSGRELRSMLSGESLPEGPHRLSWDGRDDAGNGLPSGVYFALLESRALRVARKVTLLK